MKIKFLHIVGIVIVAILVYGVIMNTLAPQFRLNHALEMNPFNIKSPLVLKQVTTGEEPDIVTFEVPISHDLLTNIGSLYLLVDDGKAGEFQECDRATNGNCLLEWNTTFDPPGQHSLQAKLFLYGRSRSGHGDTTIGPALSFYSSNVVQFDPIYSEFDYKGALLHAKVFETNASYSIELRTSSGQHIKTITGSTSNGIIEEFWDLTDEKGNHYTNMDEINVTFNVTNSTTGSSSAQKLR